MRFPLLAALEAARPHLPTSLVDTAAFATLEANAAHVPDLATSFGFECRLGESPRVDLGISVEPANGGPTALADIWSPSRHPAAPPILAVDGPPRLAHPAWTRARAFAAAWSQPSSALHAWVPFAFLEFDAGSDVTPSVFAALDWPLDPDDLPRVRHAAGQALALLLERDCSAEVARCFGALPRFARVLHVGGMLARPGRAARFSVSLPREELAAYLADVGHGDDGAALEEILERAERHLTAPYPWRPRQVDFDAGDAAAPFGIGLRPLDATQWPILLGSLVDDGLCRADKREALLAWPGVAAAEIGAPCRLTRYLSHVKVSATAGGVPEAKAYFGATPRFRLA